MNLKPLNYHPLLIKVTLLILLSLSLVATVIFSFYSYIFIILSALIGILISFLPLRDKASTTDELLCLNKCHYKLLDIFFLLFMTLVIISLLISDFSKPWLYYFGISLCSLLLGMEIMLTTKARSPYITLFKIYLLCLALFFSNQVVYPLGIGGSDAHVHFPTIISIIETGRILPNVVYSFTPLHHLLVTITSLISSLDFKFLYYVLGAFWMSINLPLIFLVGKKYINTEFGLIASLIYPFNDYLLFWSTHSAQLTYVLPFLFFTFTLILFRIDNPKFGYTIVLLILIPSIIFAHHYSSMFFIFILLSFLIGSRLCYLVGRGKCLNLSNITILFCIGLFSHWMYYSHLIVDFAHILKAYLDAVTIDLIVHQSSFSQATRYDSLPLSTIFLNTFGSNILIMLSAYGFILFAQKGGLFRNIIISWMLIIPILIVTGIFIDLRFFLPNRLYVFMQLFGLIFLASATLTAIHAKAKRYRVLLVIYAILLLLLPFFSAGSTISGFETSIFVGDQPYIKLYDTPQEKYSKIWIENYAPQDFIIYPSGSIYPNSLYGSYREDSSHSKERLPLSIEGNLLLNDFSNNSVFLFSTFDILSGFGYEPTGSFSMGSGVVIRLDSDEYYKLNSFKEMEKVYSNNITYVYYKE